MLCLLSLTIVSSCSDDNINPVTQSQNQFLLYQKPGLVDSIIGTCSTYLIRNFTLDTLDFRQFNLARLQKDSFTDGDLSEIIIYYLNADTAVNVVHLQGSHQINSSSPVDFQPPKIKTIFYMRLKLYSSVCTGNYFYLKIRNLYLFGLN